ncbi:keratin, type I cytoskeletal 10-like [Dermacentor albipictus]|uniref:keratin, type I cytoskeletal 10-like n=1 Tax=Dermacentor albipictus TaxID=60249 RepID=UPI0031FDE6D5
MMRHALFTTLLALLGAITVDRSYAQGGFYGGSSIKTGIKGGGYDISYPYVYSLPFFARGTVTISRNPGWYGGSSTYWQQQQQVPFSPFYGGSGDSMAAGLGGGSYGGSYGGSISG